MTAKERTADPTGQLREAAVLVALHTGLLRRCPIHDEVHESGQHDVQGACMVASFLINSGNPLVAQFRGDRSALFDLLRTIGSDYSPSCSKCAERPDAQPG